MIDGKKFSMLKDISDLKDWDNVHEALQEAWMRGYDNHKAKK